MTENTNPRRRPSRRKNRRTGLRAAIVVLSVILALLLGWIFLMPKDAGEITIEAGASLAQAGDFLQGAEYTEDISGMNAAVPGSYALKLSKGIFKYNATLIIRDTVAPTATVKDATVMIPGTVKPEEMVSDIVDVTDVTVAFESQPDMATPGEQAVVLVLTDLGGNTTRLDAKITVVKDTQAPTILGVQDIIAYAGGTVAYRSGITVSDDYDENVTLTLDSSGVDLSTVGTYKVIYSATDASGNTATKEATVTVMEKQAGYVEPEVIYARVDAILEQFITDDMTDREKVEAVYVWTHRGDHLIYGSAPDRTDWLQTAYEFLDRKKGDCYWFYAIQKLMLQRLNIPTIDVKKVKNFEKDSNHYWLLVSIDGGENYYHFDNVWSRQLCLVTDKTLNKFSKAVNNCFNRDESLYPATPTEELPPSKLPWNDPAIMNAKP